MAHIIFTDFFHLRLNISHRTFKNQKLNIQEAKHSRTITKNLFLNIFRKKFKINSKYEFDYQWDVIFYQRREKKTRKTSREIVGMK